MSLSSFSCAKCQYVLECVLCMFCAYFCCNDIPSSRIANFPATGKRTVEILALSGADYQLYSHSSYSHFFGERGETTFSVFVKRIFAIFTSARKQRSFRRVG